jgi:hypothetical protein
LDLMHSAEVHSFRYGLDSTRLYLPNLQLPRPLGLHLQWRRFLTSNQPGFFFWRPTFLFPAASSHAVSRATAEPPCPPAPTISTVTSLVRCLIHQGYTAMVPRRSGYLGPLRCSTTAHPRWSRTRPRMMTIPYQSESTMISRFHCYRTHRGNSGLLGSSPFSTATQEPSHDTISDVRTQLEAMVVLVTPEFESRWADRFPHRILVHKTHMLVCPKRITEANLCEANASGSVPSTRSSVSCLT